MSSYYEQLVAHQFDNLDKISRPNPWKVEAVKTPQGETDTLDRPTSINWIRN